MTEPIDPARVTPSDDPKPTAAASETKVEEGDEPENYGWDAEFDKTDYADLGLPADADEPTSDEDNSLDPPPEPVAAEVPAPSAPTPPPPAPVSTPPPAPAEAPRRVPFLPYEADRQTVGLVEKVLSTNPAERKALLDAQPAAAREKAIERLHAIDDVHRKFYANPVGYLNEVAGDLLEELLNSHAFSSRFKRVESLVLKDAGERFFNEHKIAGAEREAFGKLVQNGMSAETAREHLAMKRRLAELEGRAGKVASKEQQIDAQKASARAQQNGKSRGRSPDLKKQRQVELKNVGTDSVKIAKILQKYERLGLAMDE